MRCHRCRKKMSLSDQILCLECGHYYCLLHRYPEIHQCPKLDMIKQREIEELSQELKSSSLIRERIQKI